MSAAQRLMVLAIGLASASLAQPASAQSDVLVIAPVTVIDGTGAPPRANMAVLIAGGRIAELRPAAELAIPAGARLVDGRGAFLIPGLWDMHGHLAKAGETALALFIANGVTGVRDMGGDTDVVSSFRRAVEAGARVGPHIRLAGPMLESPDRIERMRRRGVIEPIERYRAAVADSAGAEAVVDSIARLGVDFIKVRTVASIEAYHAIAAAAHRRGLPLAGHADGIAPRELLRARQASIEHPLYPPLQGRKPAERRDVIAGFVRNGTVIVPTIVNYYMSVRLSRRQLEALVADSAGSVDPRRRYVGGFLLAHWRFQVSDRPGGVVGWARSRVIDWYYSRMLKDLQEMHRAGMRILPGTDVAVIGMVPGFSLHDELWYFVDRIGMTPMEAIVSATRHSAEFLGLDRDLGTIEIGRIADLVLLDADPLRDIRNTRHIRAVVAGGRLLDRSALDSLLVQAETRQ